MGNLGWTGGGLYACIFLCYCVQSIEIIPAPNLAVERQDGSKQTIPNQNPQIPATVAPIGKGKISKLDVERAIEESRISVLSRFAGTFQFDARFSSMVAKNVTVAGLIAEEATRLLVTRHKLTKDEVLNQLGSFSIASVDEGDCPVEDNLPCRPQKYRSHDSFCNNVQNPRWGSAIAPYGRLLPPDFSDGISALRLSATGQQLPSPSLISEKVHGVNRVASSFLTNFVAIWSQFIQNDISSPASFSDMFGTTNCCAGGSQASCIPIFSADGTQCQDYQRLCSSSRRKCALGPREALNTMTSYLDGSSVYGTLDGDESELRLFEQGLMKTSPGDLVPLMADGTVCNPRSPNSTCYKTGDLRVNGHPALIALHTLFIREHNRLVQKLSQINPLWDDDTLYEEARRINVAAIQHITYKEFLPAILGESLTESLKLKPKLSGYSTDYDIFMYPGTLEVTAGSVLDFVLSMMPEKFDTFSINGEKKKQMSMVEMPGPLSSEQVEEITLGLVSSMANRVGLSVAHGVRFLHGRDLIAEIITRGRDLGLPGYTSWRKFCGLRVPSSFEDLADMMPKANVALLKSVYANVSDIDLYSGGLAEIPLRGAIVGPTFGCLIAHQFTLLRRSDRYWYENDVPPNSFTKQQIQEVRKITLASLICKNFGNIDAVPPRVFQEKDSFLNSPVACNLMPDIDLAYWESDSPALQVPDDLMELSIIEAIKKLEKRRQDEDTLFQNNLGADPKSAVGTAFGFSRPTSEAIYMSNTSLLLEYASLQFLENLENPEFTRTRRQLFNNAVNFFNQLGQQLGGRRRPNSGRALAQGLPNVDVGRFVNPSSPPQPCRGNEVTLPCDHTTPFRTFSGWCNNLANPSFGKQLTTFSRLLPAGYDDGISRPRWRSTTGRPLPSPRLISITVHPDISSPHRRYTTILMQFGQFLGHDVTMTPVSRGVQNAILNCRDCDSTRNVHPECWPIPIPANDPFFPRVNAQGRAQCIPFTRSLAGQQRLGARDQVNQNTAYIDASQVYGETFCNSRKLRAFVGGRLNSTASPFRGKELLPQTSRMAECKASSGLCFEAGDARSSEQPGLTILHTTFMREHNRIANILQTMNPQWNDERTYLTARRITIAIWQHIIYNEFVPRTLGWNAVNLYGLNLLTEGYFEGYDATCNAQMFNEFVSAAFRFHSLVRPFFPRVNAAFQETARLPLRAGFFNPESLMEPAALDELTRGMFVTPMESLDQFVTQEVTNHLFESKNFPFSGLDLVSLNIQRGRDHGLRAYNEYRAACNLKKAATFEDLSREIAPQIIQKLRQVYATVDDIDLFTGGLSETALQGGLVGPTFACIIGNQLRTSRRCDRFWYENGNTAGRFTEAQLAEIRKVNFARVICENSDTISEITRSPFDIPHNFLNPRVQCRTLPTMDFSPWRDSARSCVAQGKVIALGASSLVSPCTSCTCTTEGAQCQSLRVDCQRLLAEVGRDAILADSVCRVQCSFVVPGAAPAPATPAFRSPAPSRQRGARFRNVFGLFG
ncbi:uncharacterized protein LOC136040414 isoform X2 [Artemia franciscana]|uniref:uncharacterized protein LOC136040414 isoform X2 n=1 Tax=Artemia franciscana TaxID=6661 RepID=UPI0032D9F3B0